VDDYSYRLQQDSNYFNYSRTNPPTPANPAFTGWQTIPGPANQGQFHYEPVWSASQGTVTLTSTGRVRGVQRTIQAVLRRSGFLEYLYLTDFESLDPESGYYSNPATATAQCSKYWWQNRPDPPTWVRISFVTGDEINGPMHTNDTISVSGTPRFNGKATTGWSGKMNCTPRTGYTFRWFGLNTCSDRPVFLSGDPTTDSLTLPTTNTAIKAETDRTLGKTGCLYTGPTRITLNASGT
jgi:hypothetical protein